MELYIKDSLKEGSKIKCINSMSTHNCSRMDDELTENKEYILLSYNIINGKYGIYLLFTIINDNGDKEEYSADRFIML